MRPKEAKRRIRLAIQKSLMDKKTSHIKNVNRELEKLAQWHKKEMEKYVGEKDELYFYGKFARDSGTPSLSELLYISDRFIAHHRLEWLRGVANSEHELFGVEGDWS